MSSRVKVGVKYRVKYEGVKGQSLPGQKQSRSQIPNRVLRSLGSVSTKSSREQSRSQIPSQVRRS